MMMNSLVNYGVNRLMGLGVVAVGIGAFYVFDQYDKRANYTPVQARISKVDELCYMEKKVGRTTTTSDVVSCDIAHYAVSRHPKWEGFDVKSKISLEYEYVSPVDNRTHSGKRSLSEWPDGKRLNRGELFQIRASKSNPDKSREI
jgi:hypothetical protein